MAAKLQEARELGLLADRLASVGLLDEALVQQRAATEAYRTCLNNTTDPMLQTTLRMMVADHSKAARNLERRIEGTEQSKARPDLNRRERALPAIPPSVTPQPQPESSKRSHPPSRMQSFGRSPGIVDFDQDMLFRSPAATRVSSAVVTPAQSTPASPSASRLVRHHSSTERMRAEGSYMFPPDADPQDSVTMFLTAIEGMLDQFDQPLNLPLAFATAPLSPQPASSVARSPSTPVRSTTRTQINQERPYKTAVSSSETGEDDSDSDSSFFMIPSSSPPLSMASTSSSPHRYPPNVYHSTSSTSTARGSGAQGEENARLSQQVEDLSARLARTEKLLQAHVEREQAMRSSVMVLRRETQRMAASTTLSPGRPSLFSQMTPSLQASLLAPTIPAPTPTPTTTSSIPTPQRPSTGAGSNLSRHVRVTSVGSAAPDHAPISHPLQPSTPTSPFTSTSPTVATPTAPLGAVVPQPPPSSLRILNPSVDVTTLGRIKDLELQLQSLKTENEQQKAQIARYRDRWQKLKENAKRKQKLAAQDAHGVGAGTGAPGKILEEDEGGRSD